MAKLFDAIATTHSVAMDQVLHARGRRNVWFDIAVALAFAVFYGFIARHLVNGMCDRFPADEPVPAIVGILAASIAASAAGVVLGELWSGFMEAVRLGNGHLAGFRGVRIPWGHHRVGYFAAGVLLFWLIASDAYARRFRAERSRRSSNLATQL